MPSAVPAPSDHSTLHATADTLSLLLNPQISQHNHQYQTDQSETITVEAKYTNCSRQAKYRTNSILGVQQITIGYRI